jgi:glycosyltransferase involved in cell wall biosynthesis
VLAGRRQVVVIHDAGVFDTPESYSLRFRTWYKMLQHGLARSGARIVTVSAFSRARIAARLGLDPDRIAVMHEGADHILRAPADTTILTRHGLFAGRFAVVVGNRVAHKNLGALQGVASVLARRGIGLAMAGGRAPGVYQAPGEDRMAGRDLGRVSDAALRALYENAVCLLFPSRYEGFGLPPVEAMACGAPVAASRRAALAETAGPAAVIDPDDIEGMTTTVAGLLGDDEARRRLSAEGVAWAARFDWDAAAGTHAELFLHQAGRT